MELALCHPSGTKNFKMTSEFLENLWALNVELALCHPSGTNNFKMASEFLENLWAADFIPIRSMCIFFTELKNWYVCHTEYRYASLNDGDTF